MDVLAVDPNHPATVYAAFPEGLSKSGDGGATWSSVGAGLPRVLALAVDPASSATLYAATASGVWKSADGGVSWSPSGAGLPPVPPGAVTTVVVDAARPGTVVAGIQGVGVFRSTDGAATWSALGSGLPASVFTGLVATAPSDPSIVYAGTIGLGLFELQLR